MLSVTHDSRNISSQIIISPSINKITTSEGLQGALTICKSTQSSFEVVSLPVQILSLKLPDAEEQLKQLQRVFENYSYQLSETIATIYQEGENIPLRNSFFTEETLQAVEKRLKEGETFRSSIRNVFKEKIAQCSTDLLSELRGFLAQTVQNVLEVFDEKSQAIGEHIKVYRRGFEHFEEFLDSAFSEAKAEFLNIPNDVLQSSKNIMQEKARILRAIEELKSERGILGKLEQELENTQRKIQENETKALQLLENKLLNIKSSQANLDFSKLLSKDHHLLSPQEEECIRLLQQSCDLYLETAKDYTSLTRDSINLFIQQLSNQLHFIILEQDKNLEVFIKKTDHIFSFLNHEANSILEVAQHIQNPKCSLIGDITLTSEDMSAYGQTMRINGGRIKKITCLTSSHVHDKVTLITGIECEYEKGGGLGMMGGVGWSPKAPSRRSFTLSSDEKITKIYVHIIDSIFSKGIDGIEWITNRGYTYGPYGTRKGDWQEISFGEDYYLGAIFGQCISSGPGMFVDNIKMEYLKSLGFAFFKDFSPVFKEDLPKRIREATTILRQHEKVSLNVEEKKKITDITPNLRRGTMSIKEAYHVLDLNLNANKGDLESAKRRLFVIYHPDKLGRFMRLGDYRRELYKERLAQIEEAYAKIKKYKGW